MEIVMGKPKEKQFDRFKFMLRFNLHLTAILNQEYPRVSLWIKDKGIDYRITITKIEPEDDR